MGKVRDDSRGFGVLELLLAIILIAIVAFIGIYVTHNRQNSLAAANTSKSSSTVNTTRANTTSTAPTPSLADAVSQTQAMYTAYAKQNFDSSTLQDKSQWATNNIPAAQDLQFINANKSFFTTKFIKTANDFKSTNTVPTGNKFLSCQNELSRMDFTASGNQVNGQTTTVTVSNDWGDSRRGGVYKIPVKLQATSREWLIDSIDLTSCSQS